MILVCLVMSSEMVYIVAYFTPDLEGRFSEVTNLSYIESFGLSARQVIRISDQKSDYVEF